MLLFVLATCFLKISATNHTYIDVCPIITGYGYGCEEYVATTSDGYKLKIQHIPPINKTARGVVFFQHGLLDSAAGVSLNGPKESLPYILHDNGYDVWLGNNRGNKVSMEHVKYTPDMDEFWDFTFDEMGLIDLPTQIEFVISATGVKQLSYIGHSEGTMQAFIGFSNTTVASRVNVFIALAPITYEFHTKSILLRVISDFYLDELAYHLGIQKFELSDAVQILLSDYCSKDPRLCEDELALLFGPSTHLNDTSLGPDMAYFPAATSMKNMAHWGQFVRVNKFDMFDYGKDGNIAHYGQSTPPLYNVNNIPKTLPIALFSGGNDYLADPIDVNHLIQDLITYNPYQYGISDYAHLDFIMAYDAYKLLYPTVLLVLNNYSQPVLL